MKKVFAQLSTHWDREWYLPFQGFRYYLIDMTDRLIEALENEEIPEFVFDGQTIVLEDYLEIRPEMRERLTSLIKNGKLKIGPWYCMPDELLAGSEALIENFLLGKKTAEQFGSEPWRFGYANDIFGHIAQFPQILNGFGIRAVYAGRGIGTQYPTGSQLLWKGADGSECYLYKDTYGSFKQAFRRVEDATQAVIDKVNSTPRDLPTLINFTDDHVVIDGDTFKFLNALKDAGIEPELDFAKYAEVMDELRDKIPTIEGELIETAYENSEFRAVTNSLSSYYPIKKRNDLCEALLWRETSPLIVLGELSGLLTGKRAFLDTARKWFMKNQPHDSICGCSRDRVHDDMPYRFAQAETIAEILRTDFIKKLTIGRNGDNLSLIVINTDLHAKKGVIELNLDVPNGCLPHFSDNTDYESYPIFAIADKSGRELPCQLLSVERGFEIYDRWDTHMVTRCKIAVDCEIAPFGITELTVLPKQKRSQTPPYRPTGIPTIENEHLSLRITASGSVELTDKASGKVYRELLTFADDVDSGNGWFHGSADQSAPTVTSHGAETRVEVLCVGELASRIKITQLMRIPSHLEKATFRRSEEYVELPIETILTLRAGERYIGCETKIINNASEHRLRLLIPSGISGETYRTSQAFCFLERPRGVSFDGLNGRECEYPEKNTSGIIDLGDLAFIGGAGIREAGVYPDGTISATLLRSVSKMFHEPHAKSAKLLGEHTYRYAIAVGSKPSELCAIMENLKTAPITFTAIGTRDLPEMLHSALSLTDERIRLSTVKPCESSDGFIVRLYNCTKETVTTSLKLREGLSAQFVRMDETPLANPTPFDGNLTLRAFEIVTLRISF